MYKILIRPLVIGDAIISWKWRNDSEIWAQTGNRPDKPITLDIENEWIEKALKDNTAKRFAITVDDQYVGNVQLTNITDSQAQFHIFIGEKSFWGKGVANQATYQILNYAKEMLKLTEIYLYVKKSNVSAIKVYEKNSFVEESQDNGNMKMICKLTDLTLPMISVFCMVYNHEKYISDAIEGFLSQKTNFNTLAVIGDDCSTDGSRNILNTYVNRFPGKFKLLYHDKNIGASKNQELVLKNCNGKYIAICEGDDYWIDPLKLQKQVDFLESNPDYTFSMGRVDMLIEKTGEIRRVKEHVDPNKSETYTLRDYLKNPFSQTSSFVFRNSNEDFPEWFHNVHAGDQSLVIIKTGKEGKIKYHKDPLSIYRLNVNSVSFNSDYVNLRNKGEYFLNNINACTGYKFNSIITFRKMINRVYYYTNSKNLFVKIFSKILVIVMMKIITKM